MFDAATTKTVETSTQHDSFKENRNHRLLLIIYRIYDMMFVTNGSCNLKFNSRVTYSFHSLQNVKGFMHHLL